MTQISNPEALLDLLLPFATESKSVLNRDGFMPWQLASNGQTAARLFIQTKQSASIKSNQFDIEEIALSEHKSF